jgi:hypothetical protein
MAERPPAFTDSHHVVGEATMSMAPVDAATGGAPPRREERRQAPRVDAERKRARAPPVSPSHANPHAVRRSQPRRITEHPADVAAGLAIRQVDAVQDGTDAT